MAKRSSKASAPTKPSARLNHSQRLAWLRLIRSENVGPATFCALVNEFGGAEAAISALPLLSRRGGRSDIRLCTEGEAERELERAERLGASLVAIGEPATRRRSPRSTRRRPSSTSKAGLNSPTFRSSPSSARTTAPPSDRNSPARSRPISHSRALSSPRGSPGESTPPRIGPRSNMAPSPCSPAASTSFIRRRTKSCNATSASGACSSASDRPASRREDRISPAATG